MAHQCGHHHCGGLVEAITAVHQQLATACQGFQHKVCSQLEGGGGEGGLGDISKAASLAGYLVDEDVDKASEFAGPNPGGREDVGDAQAVDDLCVTGLVSPAHSCSTCAPVRPPAQVHLPVQDHAWHPVDGTAARLHQPNLGEEGTKCLANYSAYPNTFQVLGAITQLIKVIGRYKLKKNCIFQ